MTYNLLKGKTGIIFGALNEKSIAWKVAEKAHEEGAKFVLTNTPVALRLGTLEKLAEDTGSQIIPADATKSEDIEHVILKSMDILGGKVDFILHSIGMSPNVRKGFTYDDLRYDNFLKTLDISALSFHKILLFARKQRTLYGYNDMADAKALLESITRSFGYIYGRDKKIRINTISQSPTITTAGSGVKGIDSLLDFTERMSPLGNATAEDCANYCVTLFSDLTKKVTMQNLYHDGGFSNMGMSLKAMTQYDKSFNDGV